MQSRYYNPTWGRFINADALVSTGQGILGNNMFAYCGNNPVLYHDPTGTRAQIWPILFEEHDPGFIHRMVQAHIIGNSMMLQKEFVMPGIGRADIYKPATGEIWEIKHGGSNIETISKRTGNAAGQVERYISRYTVSTLKLGSANAFSGAFVINCDGVSYSITYDTPQQGVILYYVKQIDTYETAPYAVKLLNKSTTPTVLKSLVCATAFVGLVVLSGGLSRVDSLGAASFAY